MCAKIQTMITGVSDLTSSVACCGGMDNRYVLDVVPQPINRSPLIEPLTDEVVQQLPAMHDSAVVPLAVQQHNAVANTVPCRASQKFSSIVHLLKRMPVADQESIEAKIDALLEEARQVCLNAALPVTTKQYMKKETAHWNRQPTDHYVRALFKRSTRAQQKVEKAHSITRNAVLRKRAATAKAALVVAAEGVAEQGKLPRVVPSGRPKQKVVGVAAGGNFARGARSYGIRVSSAAGQEALRQQQAAAAAAIFQGASKSRKCTRRRGAQKRPLSQK